MATHGRGLLRLLMVAHKFSCRSSTQKCNPLFIPSAYYSTPKKIIAATGGKMGKGLGPVMEKKTLEVEADPEKLVTTVCGSNIYKEGSDVQIKEDKEYPEWLWTLRLGPPPPLEEMDQNTLAYWRRLFKLNNRKLMALKKLRKF